MPARLIQLTDLHLWADPLGEVRGVRTRETFERVLAAAIPFLDSADRLIITGDLTHDEQLATYEFLRERLQPWISKLRVIPGNHDDRTLLRTVFADRVMACGERIVFHDQVAGWQLIGLDSHVPGSLHGELGPDQTEWLVERCRSQPAAPTCLFLHHPPIAVHSAWLDRIGLADAATLREAAAALPQIQAVVCGHIHQELTAVQQGVLYLAAPSTGVQFRPQTDALEVDSLAPGFRVLDLEPDSSIRTRVARVTA